MFNDLMSRIPKDKVKTIKSNTRKHCEKCGRDYDHIIYEDDTVFKLGCDCEMIALGIENRKRYKERINRERINSIFNKSLVNKVTQKATLENYEPTSDNLKKALKVARRYINSFDLEEPRSLYLHGSFGTGKSHLAYGIAKELKEQGYSVLFMNVAQLMSLIRSSYDKSTDYTEIEIKNLINSVDVMVFDDFGVADSNHSLENIFEIIDARLGKHNIYTTNLSAKDISKSIKGQRILSRIIGDSYLIDMNGEDYRTRNL